MVAACTSREATSITQPVSTQAVGPSPSSSGTRVSSCRSPTLGAVRENRAGSRRSSRVAWERARPAPIAAIAQGRASTQPMPRRRAVRSGRGRRASTWARAASTIRPNGTPLGQAVSQARHARHSSIIVANSSSTSARPSMTARIAKMRPRGEAVSRPVTRKVGQCGRHSPHDTQETTSSSAGAITPGSQLGAPRGGIMWPSSLMPPTVPRRR